MSTLNLVRNRINELWSDPESGNLEDIATLFLVGLLSVVTLIAII